MADNMFKVEIITPDRVFFTGDADMIEFNTVQGQIGVYKNHIPLTTVLEPGVVTIHEGDVQKVAAVHAGFAEQRLSNKTADLDIKRAEFALHKALTRISVAENR